MEEDKEQPKDYETYEEYLDSGWKELNAWGKVTYKLQDHVWKAIFIVGSVGYIAGMYFGKFW